jgi:MOSC domain-containing protein YiiM
MPHIFQINISNGGVPKLALRQAEVTFLGVAGDSHRSKDHGGPDRAICLFALENILSLQAEGHPIFPGSAGENLTLVEADWSKMIPGARLRLGSEVLIELTHFTTPCSTIADSFSGKDFSRILQEKHPGWSRIYARVLKTGQIRVGDQVETLSG